MEKRTSIHVENTHKDTDFHNFRSMYCSCCFFPGTIEEKTDQTPVHLGCSGLTGTVPVHDYKQWSIQRLSLLVSQLNIIKILLRPCFILVRVVSIPMQTWGEHANAHNGIIKQILAEERRHTASLNTNRLLLPYCCVIMPFSDTAHTAQQTSKLNSATFQSGFL